MSTPRSSGADRQGAATHRAPHTPRSGERRAVVGAAALRWLSAAAVALVGFALVTQAFSPGVEAERLIYEREEDLAAILADLTARGDALQREVGELELLLFEYESSAEAEDVARRNLYERLAELRVLAGEVPVRGEGVRLTVADPQGALAASDLLDVVHELRDAGATAIAVNDVRLVASSAFSGAPGAVRLDAATLTAPYTVLAVGPPDALTSALQLPGGVLDTLALTDDVSVDLRALEDLTVPRRTEAVEFRYAEPLEQDAADGAAGSGE